MSDHRLMPVEPTPEMLSSAMAVCTGFSGDYGMHNDHLSEDAAREVYQAFRSTAPAVQGEPVAWMHDSPGRMDVIHAAVKKLLADSHDAAGHLHRPLDKSQHYTIPLYAAPQPAEQQPAPDVAGLVEALKWLRGAINCTPENDKHQSGAWISTSHPRIKRIDALIAACRKGGEA